MSSKLRRYEILLPQQYNDGTEIPRKLRGQALREIVDRFGAASFEPTTIEGYWRFEGTLYTDSLSKIVIDIEDTDEHRQWMRDFKERWKVKLDQLELWLVSYEIDVD
ncbi:MAG: hypothetical protein KF762_17945 [Acidobacteria bacterium]|nr:hypothetical protein [Acidobacteriota bacterium]